MKYPITFLCLLLPACATAQRVTGRVMNDLNEPLPGAAVHWLGTQVGVTTGADGSFELPFVAAQDNRVVAAYAGHRPDTLAPDSLGQVVFRLQVTRSLEDVVIEGQQDGVLISDETAAKTEQITETELKKAACCDLAGCFETQTTVQPQTTNVITHSRELRILGLSGVYNQVLVDGFPMIQGLTYTYGISSIPGTLVKNIYVSKGANSVLQGYESISGQINVETQEPDDTDRLLLNAYVNRFQEKHANAAFSFRRKAWSNVTAAHMIQPARRIDRDADLFTDLPQLTRYMLFNTWKYRDADSLGWNSRVGLRVLHEQRVGGQMAYDAARDRGSRSVYGQRVLLQQPELWTRTGYRFSSAHQLFLMASGSHQQQESCFGTVLYDARQTLIYANLQYEYVYSGHDLKTGISYRHLNLHEAIAFTDTLLPRSYAGLYHREENIPGVFAENTLRLLEDKLTWIAGVRADHHSQFGTQVTPRTLVKYDLRPRTILRLNAGTGWRTVNYFSENTGLLVSSRDIILAERLLPEKALNLGMNLTQKFETASENLSGYVTADFYHTRFQNQFFPDYDTDPGLAILRNFTGRSISNGFQAEANLRLWRRFEWKTGYSYLDVYRETAAGKQRLPFNPMHKVLLSLSYQPLHTRFHADVNAHGYGKQRLPDTRSNPAEFQRPDYSRPYVLVNAQFTYNFTRLELYAGCENIADFRQIRPILGWQNPFGPYFDTSSVWGPTRGRELYLGLRYRIRYP